MFGAPFDWRQSSQGSQQFYTDMKSLIEKVYADSKKKVSILAPSYGPQLVLGFLQLMTQEWKDQYLSWFVASSPVWSGSSTALYSMVGGLSLLPNASDLMNRNFRNFEVALPAMMWLSPQAGEDNYTYSKKEPLVLTPSQNYSAYDLTKMLLGVGYSEFVAQAEYLQQSGSLYKFEPPMVNTWVNYGYNVDTLISFTLDSDLTPSKMPKLLNYTMGSGDDTVTVKSSLRSMNWTVAHSKAQKQLIHSGYSSMLHAGCLLPMVDPNHTACFAELMNLLTNGTLPKPTPPPTFEE